MTFCLGIAVQEGLVGIADTRITSGNEVITARKVSTFQTEKGSFFLMTSGLRSLRDKSLTYFEDKFEQQDWSAHDKLFKVANTFASQVRKVAVEDKEAIKENGLSFDIHTLIGGQMENDTEHKLYVIYPEGNWIEVTKGTPYHIIGERGYGKPVLDRTLTYEDQIRFALKVGCLAFDSTRISASDVDFPVDVILYLKDSSKLVEHRFERSDLADISSWWQERLRESVQALPSEWVDNIASKLSIIEKSKSY